MKCYKIFLLIAILNLMSGSCFSQNKEMDSLQAAFKSHGYDSNKVNVMIDIAEVYRKTGAPDLAIKTLLQTDSLATKINYLLGRAKVNNNLCINYDDAGLYTKALEKGLEAVRINEIIGWIRGLASNYASVGNVYKSLGEYKRALEYFFKADRILNKLENKTGMARNFGNIGTVFFIENDFAGARNYYTKGLDIYKELKNKKGISIMTGNLALLYMKQNKPDTAYLYLCTSLQISKELGNKRNIATTYQNLGDALRKMNKPKESERYTLMGLSLADSIKYTGLSKSCHENLNDLYEAQGDFRKALFHYKKYIAIRDSLFNEENTKETVRLEMNFEFEKKEAAAKLEQEKKEAVAAAESRKQKIIIWSVCGILILVIGFAIFAYRSYLQKQKSNIEIIKQKEIIEVKQKEILDSIHYAKRIQTALLPSEKYFERNLNKLRNEIN